MLSSESIQDMFNASNQINQKEFSNKELMEDLEGLLCVENVPSHPSNSIRFID
jgi:hypothetical protein